MDPIVTVERLSKKYSRNADAHLGYALGDLFREMMGKNRSEDFREDEFLAVNDVSFKLDAGDSLALIGRNGSGKTTILKMLTGLARIIRKGSDFGSQDGVIVSRTKDRTLPLSSAGHGGRKIGRMARCERPAGQLRRGRSREAR